MFAANTPPSIWVAWVTVGLPASSTPRRPKGSVFASAMFVSVWPVVMFVAVEFKRLVVSSDRAYWVRQLNSEMFRPLLPVAPVRGTSVPPERLVPLFSV